MLVQLKSQHVNEIREISKEHTIRSSIHINCLGMA